MKDMNELAEEMKGLNQLKPAKADTNFAPEAEDYSPYVKETFIYAAERLVYRYVKARLEKTDMHVTFGPDEVYVVWFCKTLQNWKAMVSTTLPDGMYYEVTYNGDKREAYIDAYKKFENVCVPDDDELPEKVDGRVLGDTGDHWSVPRQA